MLGPIPGLLATDQEKQKEALSSEPVRAKYAWLQRGLPFLSFLAGRLLNGIVTFLIVTSAVMSVTLLIPPEERARNYLPERLKYLDTALSVASSIEPLRFLDWTIPFRFNMCVGWEIF